MIEAGMTLPRLKFSMEILRTMEQVSKTIREESKLRGVTFVAILLDTKVQKCVHTK